MYATLVDFGIAQNAFHGLESLPEKVAAKLLESGAGNGGIEIDTVVQRVDFDRGLRSGGKGTLGAFAGGSETMECTRVGAKV
jgi:hypothetical protein